MKVRIKLLWSSLSIKSKILIYLIVTLAVNGLFMSISFYQGAWYLQQFENQTSLYYEINDFKNNYNAATNYLEQYVVHDNSDALVLFQETKSIMDVQILRIRSDVRYISVQSDILSRSITNLYDNYVEKVNLIIPQNKDINHYIIYYEEINSIEDYTLIYCDHLLNDCLNSGQEFYYKMQEELEQFKQLTVAFLVLFIIIIGFTFNKMLDKNILKPIQALCNDAIQISNGNLDEPEIITKNNDEMKQLTKVFYSMKQSMKEELSILHEKQEITEELHVQELNVVTMQNLLIQEKALLLQAQVKPHFLYNALNTIARTAKIEKASITENLIISLSKLFRYIIKTENSMVALEREIAIVNDYINIQKSRFGDRLDLEWRISQDVDINNLFVPSFILQPLVENSICHGLASKLEGGFIRIRIHKSQDYLTILIGDNGIGMDKERLNEVRRYESKDTSTGRGIGIANVAKRVELLGGKSSFHVMSKYQVGTVIKIKINIKVLDAYV